MLRVIFFGLGCLYTTVYEPTGFWPLAPVLLLPFLYISLTRSGRFAAKHAFYFGLGWFLTGTWASFAEQSDEQLQQTLADWSAKENSIARMALKGLTQPMHMAWYVKPEAAASCARTRTSTRV